jgi:hypothetical protein
MMLAGCAGLGERRKGKSKLASLRDPRKYHYCIPIIMIIYLVTGSLRKRESELVHRLVKGFSLLFDSRLGSPPVSHLQLRRRLASL